MADAPVTPTFTVTAPPDFKYEEGKPIQFDLPVSSFDLTKFAPKEIAEKDYFKKIKSSDDLFKAFDGAQVALGKPKYGVPATDAPQETWDEFIAASRPKTADEYVFDEDPSIPKELKAPPEIQKAFKELLYTEGVAPRTAKNLQKGYDKIVMAVHKMEADKNAAIDKQFDETIKTVLGDKAKEELETSKRVMAYLLPKELHPFIGKINNEGLAMMAALTRQVKAKYMKEDELPPASDTSGGGGSKEELRAKAMTLQAEAMKLDSMDPNKKKKMDEATELYQRISKM